MKIPFAIIALAATVTTFAEVHPVEWKKPSTSRRYLHGPFAERLIVCWREGKVTIGETRHEHDWSKTHYYHAETSPQAFGVWLVHGENNEPFDFKAASMRMEPDATPIHGQSWRQGDMEVDLEACSPFGRRPSANMRLRVVNHGITNISHTFTMLLRSAAERSLVFSAPDGYYPYSPVLAQWQKVPCTWKNDSACVWRDGERFLAGSPGVDAAWDASLGGVRFTVSLAPGAARRIDWVLGEGRPEPPDYDKARVQTRTDWQRELARVADRSWLIRRMTVEMLQCFSRPIGKDYALPRQGCLQRWVWPGDQMYVSKALGRLGYGEYVEAAIDFYFGQYLNADGSVGPFGNNWACDTACVLYIFAGYCVDTGNAACWARHRASAEKAFGWIKAKRRESVGMKDCVEGLFPPMKATDAGGAFQAWGNTDLVNIMAMEAFADAMEKFAPAEAAPVRAEARAYRDVIVGLLEHWRKVAEGRPYFHIPLDPLGKEDATLRRRNYFYSHPGRFVAMGFLSQDEMLRLRNWLLKEGYADERGLYMRQPTCICWDNGEMIPFGIAHNVWYTTSAELGWFSAWKAVGRDDLAGEIFDAMLKYSVTEEGCVGERYCSSNPWFYPWSPNASGAGRIVLMALGCGLNKEVAK